MKVLAEIAVMLFFLFVAGYMVWANGEQAGEAMTYRTMALQADGDRQDMQKQLDRCRGIGRQIGRKERQP